ncbi:hypothetical protein ABZ769_05535 [Streptomyces olivoreticuli]
MTSPNADDRGYAALFPAPQGRAHEDCAERVVEQLYRLPMVIESVATMTVINSFHRIFTLERRSAVLQLQNFQDALRAGMA